RGPDRFPIFIPTREHYGAAQLYQAHSSRKRVLAPALQSAEHALAVGEPATLVNGVPPEQEASLLQGPQERLTGIRAGGLVQVRSHPVQDLPPACLPGQIPASSLSPAAGRTHDARRSRNQLRSVDQHCFLLLLSLSHSFADHLRDVDQTALALLPLGLQAHPAPV